MAPRTHLLALPPSILRTFLPFSPPIPSHRPFSSQYPTTAPSSTPTPTSTSKWLSTTKFRIGKCIMFGLNDTQISDAARILGILGREWRALVAGREGYLTDGKNAGLVRQRVVWGEMDCMGHVNNVTYVRYAESARIQWAWNIAKHRDQGNRKRWEELWTPRGTGLILKSMKTEYKFPMVWPDHVSVFHKLRFDPSSSLSSSEEPGGGFQGGVFWLDVIIMSELKQRIAALCEEEIVVYDYRAGVRGRVEGWMRDAFERVGREQDEERERVVRRIEEVEGMVGALEEGTWRREGAVEDMGNSK